MVATAPNPTPGAVFLSYAREDSDAARRLSDALSAFGVEVWFDQNELRGGDVWDAKIRRQIRECVLFVPIISAHTQTRGEGYFRLEWKLAVERTHLMAEGVPFLAPVAIDDTPESRALVPPEFLRVQWSRLPGALPTPDFVHRIRALLAPAGARISAAPAVRESAHAAAVTLSDPNQSRTRWRLWTGGAIAAIVIGVFVALRSTRPSAGAASAPNAAHDPTATTPRPVSSSPSLSNPPAVDSKSIAVLPFANMSDEKENGYFCDGIQEDILTNLGNIADLRVVSRTSVMQYRGTTKPIRQIAQELGVAWVLEGSVQRAGKRVRVTGQLINARTDEHAWAKAYDRDLDDVFAIQAELAQAIATALQAKVSPQEQQRITQKPTENIAAYELVLQARAIRNTPLTASTGRDWITRQEALLQQALQLDPNYALAYADLTYLYTFGQFASIDSRYDAGDEALRRAKAAVDAAVRLAPESPEVMRALGDYYYYGKHDYPAAMVQYRAVQQIRPDDPEVLNRLASILRRQAKWTESLATFRQLDAIDPGNVHNLQDIAVLLSAGRRFDECIATVDRIRALTPARLEARFDAAFIRYLATGATADMDAFWAGLTKAEAESATGWSLRKRWALYHGDLDEILRADAATLRPDDPSFSAAVVLALRGDRDGARRRLAGYFDETEKQLRAQPGNAILWGYLANDYAVLGNRVDALRCINRAVELAPESRDAIEAANVRASRAFVYAWLGDKDAAIAAYAAVLRTPFGYMAGAGTVNDATVQVMRRSPYYAPLRDDPRFQALLDDPKNNAPLF